MALGCDCGGGAVGGVGALLLLLLMAYWCYRQRIKGHSHPKVRCTPLVQAAQCLPRSRHPCSSPRVQVQPTPVGSQNPMPPFVQSGSASTLLEGHERETWCFCFPLRKGAGRSSQGSPSTFVEAFNGGGVAPLTPGNEWHFFLSHSAPD